MKTCHDCRKRKRASKFYKSDCTSDGLNYRCIECQNAYNASYSLARVLAKCHPLVISTFRYAPMRRLRRFARKVNVTPTCWLWTGSRHPRNGYARVWFDKHDDHLAHRVAFEWARGAIPDGLVIDHICRVRHCVNPDHMELVTSVENVMRGVSAWAINARKTHCLRGHEFTSENTYLYNGMRHCRECTRLRKRERRARASLASPSVISG